MALTKLNYNDIVDCKKSWKDIVGYNAEDVNPYHSDRINNFIDNCYPEKLNNKNIDLSTLLILLKYRNCEIEIPEYENLHAEKDKSSVIKVGNKRHGKIISLKSNQSTFNFSVTILDEMYKEEKVNGEYETAPRTYTITDYKGDFHNNWDKFVFQLTDKEKVYFGDSFENGSIHCNTFVNNSLAQSMYTEYYRNMKLFIERLVAERKYISDIKKEYLPKCKVLNNSDFTLVTETKTEDKDKYSSRKVKCFETKLSVLPEFEFDYIDKTKTPEEIVQQCNMYFKGIIDCTGDYKFLCRLIEFAFTNMNPYKDDLKPTELLSYNRNDCKWNEQKVKLPRSKIEWFELMFKDYSLLCRYFDKTIQIKNKE